MVSRLFRIQDYNIMRLHRLRLYIALLVMIFPSVIFAEDHPTEYLWGNITIYVGETTELSISSDFDYATAYINFNTTWECPDGHVEILTRGTSNRTYCTVKGLLNTHGFPSKVKCQLAYRTSSSSLQYQVWHGYYNVYVEPNVIKVTDITLNRNSLTLQEKQTDTLIASVKPDDATDKSVTWSSSNTSVATVSSNGLVTAKTEGSATITCRANDGSGKYATCSVSVTKSDPVVAEINATNFPDATFRNWLLERDFGKDGKLTESEIGYVTNIGVLGSLSSPGNIKSLKGIEFFTSLKYLGCSYNQLASLDVSKNTALTELWCDADNLSSLDVSKNTALTRLWCEGNQLTALDVSKNTALTDLACSANQLTSLDVSRNAALTRLECFRNNIKGAAIDALINSLPQNNSSEIYRFFVIDDRKGDEGNVCTKAQVMAAKAKGWTPLYNNGSKWEEYEGSDDTKGTTIDDPFTPDEAYAYGGTLGKNEQSEKEYYVRGMVSSIREQFGTQYGNATFYISSDGTEQNQFYVYRALYLGNTKYAGQGPLLREGDDVVVCGKITNYNGTLPETVQNKAYVVSINGETTGIRGVVMASDEQQPVYSVSGQRLVKPRKGLNIIGGRKVVVK